MRRSSKARAPAPRRSSARRWRPSTKRSRRFSQGSSSGRARNAPRQTLAEEQARVREEILDLARRIQERKDPRSRPDLAQADSQARAAENSLQQGDPSSAEQQETEVERELRQAKRELEEEEQQYQRLRAEEQLFRIAEETAALLEAHKKQMHELLDVDRERAGAAAPSRAQKMRLRNIAREEGTLGTRAEELAKAIEEEGTKVAAGLMSNAASDLARLKLELSEEGDYQTGERVQGLQRDVEEAFLWLLDALRAEQQRRQNDSKNQNQNQSGGQNQNQGRQPLIPDSTELKLLWRMEQELRESVDALRLQHPDAGEEPSAALLRDLTHLAARHERLTALFRDLRGRVGIPAPEEAED